MIAAIIDLGSNSARMDIVEIFENGEYEYKERLRKLVKLSEGMEADGCIQTEAAGRAVEALAEFKSVMDMYNVDTTIAVATAAVRKAKNSDVFIDEVEDKTGITIEVIRGEKEAEYDFLGVISTLDIEDCVIADTGGGSTELILVIGGDALARVSLPIGAVNMTERFMGYGETKDALEGLDDYIDSHLDKINWLGDAEGLPIVCMGGSMYNFAILEQGLSGFESGLHGYTIPAREAVNANEILLGMSESERESAGIESGRLDTIVCGVAPVMELMKKIDSDELVICTSTLRDGILAEIIENM